MVARYEQNYEGGWKIYRSKNPVGQINCQKERQYPFFDSDLDDIIPFPSKVYLKSDEIHKR